MRILNEEIKKKIIQLIDQKLEEEENYNYINLPLKQVNYQINNLIDNNTSNDFKQKWEDSEELLYEKTIILFRISQYLMNCIIEKPKDNWYW